MKGVVNVGVSLYGINKVVGTPDAIIRSSDTALSQIRETISVYPASVKNGAISHSDALVELDALDDLVTQYEADIKKWSIYSISARTNPEFISPMLIRAEKLHSFIALAKQDVLISLANPQNPQLTELNSILGELGSEEGEFGFKFPELTQDEINAIPPSELPTTFNF